MTPSLDLFLLPIVRMGGLDRAELRGLHIGVPPRRISRGRSQDRLIIQYSQEGSAQLTPNTLDKLLERLTQTYYKTTGSSTAAMRILAESLNQFLLERNLRGANQGLQSVGILTLIVLRGNRLYLAQSGSTHAYLFSAEGTQHLHDPSTAGRGLGLGRATAIRYYQSELSPGDTLLISASPPPVWTTTTLSGLREMDLEGMHKRLLHHAGPELEAVLIQIQKGSGRLRLLRSGPKKEPRRTLEVLSEAEEKAVPSPPVPIAETKPLEEPEMDEAQDLPEDRLVIPDIPPPQPEAMTQTEALSVEGPKEEPRPKKPRKPSPIGPMLATVGRAVADTSRQASQGIRNFTKRMLPDETIFSIPASMMAFIAVAIPLIILTIASVVYFQRGRGRLYQEYFIQAQSMASQATQLEDPKELHAAWQVTIHYLDQAEGYQVTGESQALRSYALSALDQLDIVERLDFQSAIIGGLPSSANISRIVATIDNELYLLDSTEGNVFRAVFTEGGFEVDQGFWCGPVPQPLIVGPLVDIAPLPLGNENQATVLGMDANGNLLQCIPGGKPPLAFQMGPPDTNWGEPVAFALDSTDLYILDPQTNAVWIYWGRDEYRERPSLFFGDQVPPMGDVLDLTVSGDDLFMLHADGHLTTCIFSYIREAPTRCTDPAIFTDLRVGRESGVLIADAIFSEIQFAPPPDPSIYLLDSQAHSIYHFSLRLALQRQYRSQTILSDEPATAFAISPNRLAFLAIENQVYYAPMP